MARSIKEIQQDMINSLREEIEDLSTSKTAEWRLITYIVAASIHVFEVILGLFRNEVDKVAYSSAIGSAAWFAEICRRYQQGHILVYNPETAGYDYAVPDEKARIVKIVAVSEDATKDIVLIKVATQDEAGKIKPLSEEERQGLSDYIERKKIAGTPVLLTSTSPDIIKYDIEIFYDPSYPRANVEKNVKDALETFKTNLSFDSMFYKQKLFEKLVQTAGVVTIDPKSIMHKSVNDDSFKDIDVNQELSSGYFDYDSNCIITYKTAR